MIVLIEKVDHHFPLERKSKKTNLGYITSLVPEFFQICVSLVSELLRVSNMSMNFIFFFQYVPER